MCVHPAISLALSGLTVIATYPNHVASLNYWVPMGRRGGSQGGHAGPPLQGSSGVERDSSACRWARILASIPMSSGAMGEPTTPQPAANEHNTVKARVHRRAGPWKSCNMSRLSVSWRDAPPMRSFAGSPVCGTCPRFGPSGQRPLRGSGTATRPWKNAGTRP